MYADHAIGRYDLHGASGPDLRRSLSALADLDVNILLPGHNRIVEGLPPATSADDRGSSWAPYLGCNQRGGRMNRRDEWGRDPSVHAMRGVFGLMESFQDRFLEQVNIDRYDPRLRAWRERAKTRFEQSWAKAAGDRIQLRQEQRRNPILAVSRGCDSLGRHSDPE